MSGAATSLCECARTHWELPNAHMSYGQNLVHGEGTSLSRVGPYRFCRPYWGYRFRVGPYRFCTDGNPTTLSILLWSYLILSDTHMFWRTSRDGTYDMFPTATKAAVFFLPLHASACTWLHPRKGIGIKFDMTRTVPVKLFESDNFYTPNKKDFQLLDCVYSFKLNCLHSESTWQNIWQNKVDLLILGEQCHNSPLTLFMTIVCQMLTLSI